MVAIVRSGVKFDPEYKHPKIAALFFLIFVCFYLSYRVGSVIYEFGESNFYPVDKLMVIVCRLGKGYGGNFEKLLVEL